MKELTNDDAVYIKQKDGLKRVYGVVEKKEISPNEVGYLAQDDSETREVTLITCTNIKNKRLVVKCREFV